MQQRHTAGHSVHASLYELEGRIDALFKELMRDSVIRFLILGSADSLCIHEYWGLLIHYVFMNHGYISLHTMQTGPNKQRRSSRHVEAFVEACAIIKQVANELQNIACI